MISSDYDRAEVLDVIRQWPRVPLGCLCGSTRYEVLAPLERFGLDCPTLLCADCGLVRRAWTWPEEQQLRFYEDHYRALTPLATCEVRWEHQLRTGVVIQEMLSTTHPQSVIEIGCDTGGALSVIVAQHKSGVELGRDARQWARAHGLDVNRIPVLYETDRADVLIASHVLEHCADPLAVLRGWSALGELLLIIVPDVLSVTDPPGWWRVDHCWDWSQETFRRTLMQAGLKAWTLTRWLPGTLANIGSICALCSAATDADEVRAHFEGLP